MIELPSPFSSLSRESLLYAQPSPIERLDRLTAELSKSGSDKTQYWIKREDSNSGLAIGGNKIRKLEYVISDALRQGATTLVTTGGLQSNHMRQVAAAAAKYGLKTHLISKDVVKSSDPEYKTLGNIQITSLLGAEHASYDADAEKIMKECSGNREVPYWIPSGASTHPLGGLGYARFAFEVAAQEEELGIYFDTIIVASASGSTLGGMVVGFKLLEQSSAHESGNRKSRQLIGVDAMAQTSGKTAATVLGIARSTAQKVGLKESEISAEDVVVDERWNAGAYGFVDEPTTNAVKLLAQKEGILLDPVYTGKAFAGLLGMAREGELRECQNVLFIHTGGVPALSAYPNVR